MDKSTNLYGVILAGGSGSRLWPLSREMYPKQLLKLNQDNTLLQSTFLRLAEIVPLKNILTVTNIKHKSDVKLQLNKIYSNLDRNNIIVEPIGKNTASAIGLSVFHIMKSLEDKDNDPVIIVAPSDHLVRGCQQFTNAVKNGIKLAEAGYIVTFGIKPDRPDTGYGYINTVKSDEISKIESAGLKVQVFKEKPDIERAREYCALGTYYWNSGIFIFRASILLNELKIHSREIFDILEKSNLTNSGPTIKFDDYNKLPDISIDYAIMEKSGNIVLVPLDCGWNDMGSWQAIYDISQKDNNNNFISGNVIDVNSKNCLIYSTSKLVSTIGLEDVVIVETEDAILACDKNKTQDVKKVFENLKRSNNQACIIHNTVYRPWGYYTVLQKDEGYLIKIIQVNPKSKLSLQMHHHRSEHWVVLSGTAKVIKDDNEFILKPGDSIDIPIEAKHSLENFENSDLKIIEVQKGDYLDEDDIVRFEDIYGRTLP